MLVIGIDVARPGIAGEHIGDADPLRVEARVVMGIGLHRGEPDIVEAHRRVPPDRGADRRGHAGEAVIALAQDMARHVHDAGVGGDGGRRRAERLADRRLAIAGGHPAGVVHGLAERRGGGAGERDTGEKTKRHDPLL